VLAWNKVEAAAREQYSHASDEKIYQITKATIDKSLALSAGK